MLGAPTGDADRRGHGDHIGGILEIHGGTLGDQVAGGVVQTEGQLIGTGGNLVVHGAGGGLKLGSQLLELLKVFPAVLLVVDEGVYQGAGGGGACGIGQENLVIEVFGQYFVIVRGNLVGGAAMVE